MNLNRQLELAQALFGHGERQGIERVSATATADSSDGEVTVRFDDGSTVSVPVIGSVQAGDEVIIDVQDGVPVAAGAAGWGDRVNVAVAAAAQAADDAARYATDYLTFSQSGGLTVGASSLDRSVNINAGGMDVLDGSDVLGHYGSYIGLGGGNGNDGILLTVDYPTEATGIGADEWAGVTTSVQAYSGSIGTAYYGAADLWDESYVGWVAGQNYRFYSAGFYLPTSDEYVPPLVFTLVPSRSVEGVQQGGFRFNTQTGAVAWYSDPDSSTGLFSDCTIGMELAQPAYMRVNGSIAAHEAAFDAITSPIATSSALGVVKVGDGLSVDAAGLLTNDGAVGAVGLSGASAITGIGTTARTIGFSSTTGDTDLVELSGGIATVADAGVYLVSCDAMMYQGSSANTRFTLRLKTGSSTPSDTACSQSAEISSIYGASNPVGIHLTHVLSLGAGDKLAFTVESSNSGAALSADNTHASIVKVGGAYSGGGSGGTSDYSQLSNKPSINSVTLSGDKTSSQLGVADASHTHTASEITSGLAAVATSGDYSDLSNTPTIPSSPSDIGAAAASHTHIASDITSGLAAVATSGDYVDLVNKPTIPDAAPVFYGTCSTAAGTQAKAVTCSNFAASDLVAGTVLFVKFANAQTYNGSPTLDVNSTGAVATYRNGTTATARYQWLAGEVVCFVHDGTGWQISDGGFATTTYYGATRLSSSVSSTSTALAATPSAVKQAYDLAAAAAPASSLATVATSGDYADLGGTPQLAAVATSGSYNDLSGTPTIPTATSQLANDSGFITDAGVTSFNGSTGAVTYTAPVTSVNGSTGAVTVSVPTATATTPSMDGTAAAGSSTEYARADHVHPTDTSRAAASHTHAIADTTGLQNALDGKAASSHTHAASDIDSGTLDASRLPVATTSALGGVKLNADYPTVSSQNVAVTADANGKMYVDPTHLTAGLGYYGALQGGSGVSVKAYDDDDGCILISGTKATSSALGVVKPDNSTITVDASGTISATGGGGGSQTTFYGTCSTLASTAEKSVTCSGFALAAGSIVGVLFTTANTAATPTLNVNSTGAKSIYIGSATPSATTNVLKWSANTMLYFMYDGTYYRYICSVAAGSVTQPDGGGTWYAASSAGAATAAAKTATITNFRLTAGAVVHIKTSYANTLAGALTLNVSSTGAKTIYANNAATSASNALTWTAGELLTFVYDGSYWRFMCRDNPSAASLPIASASTLGGVKVGSGLSINASTGVLSVSSSFAPLYLPDVFSPSVTAAQTMSTSPQLVTGLDNGDRAYSGNVNADSDYFTFAEAGIYKVRAQVGMYPNTTAATRLCVGIYSGEYDLSERIALGVQAVTNLSADTASKVVTIACEAIFETDGSTTIGVAAWADVTGAKVSKNDTSITNVTFERIV